MKRYYYVFYQYKDGFGSCTFSNNSKGLFLGAANQWIRDQGCPDALIVNAMRINKKQYEEYHEWKITTYSSD